MVRKSCKRPARHRAISALTAVTTTLFLIAVASSWLRESSAQTRRFVGPTSSQPIALTADDGLLAVANPDNDTVSIFDVLRDANLRRAEIPVGREPNGVAFLPSGSKLYVANTVSGTVSVISLDSARGSGAVVSKTINVGVEPHGLVLTPNGSKLYVSNSASNSLSVINTDTDQVVSTIPNVLFGPRGLAITNDGDSDDADEILFVTQFLAQAAPSVLDGNDNSRVGKVGRVSTGSDTILDIVTLNPLQDSGFKAAGDALGRIPVPGNPQPQDYKFTTGAFPNQLNGLALHGHFLYVPSTGASPNGPFRFDVNVQSLVSVIRPSSGQDANLTINLNQAIDQQGDANKLFATQPWAIAFENNAPEGLVVSAASDSLFKVAVDPATGAIRLVWSGAPPKVGENPRGIVINSTDSRAFVMNYVSRDVSVVDLTRTPEMVLGTMRSAALPDPGSPQATVQIGKRLFNTSVGHFDPPASGQQPIAGRLSEQGWGSCGSCHPDGLSDNVTWIFQDGPRRTPSLHTTFSNIDQSQHLLNWSATMDEIEDFELNIRLVSGGLGLLVGQDGTTPAPGIESLIPENGARRQLKIGGVDAFTALETYLQSGIRSPISAIPKSDPSVIRGEQVFQSANCQLCHGGPRWSSFPLDFTPPPNPSRILEGHIIASICQVGTFNPALANEIGASANPPRGALGFNPPSLLSIYPFTQSLLHNGSKHSLDEVLDERVHRSAGTPGRDTLVNPADRAALVEFVKSIDATTRAIRP